MPQFYFHVQDESGYTLDPEGQELPDAEAARREAVSATREILGETLLHGGALNHRTIEIAGRGWPCGGPRQFPRRPVPGWTVSQLFDDVTQSAPANRPSK
jgi:hypothetical protein